MELRDRVLGATYGHLVGDALGVPFEFKGPGEIPAEPEFNGYGSHGQPAGTWSDDGALMLCQVASLLECGGFDPGDTAMRFVRWLYEGYMAVGGEVFDVGTTTRVAVDRIHDGVAPLDAGLSHEGNNGNGSLMRVLPVSLWTLGGLPDEQVRLAHDASRLTHGHRRSQVCCALHGVYAAKLLEQGPDGAWDTALQNVRQVYAGMGPEGGLFAVELDVVENRDPEYGGFYVVDTLLSAKKALEGSVDYASAAWEAVRFGSDTDTTAAVTGGLAGFYYGLGSLPRPWRLGLRMEGEHHDLLTRFAEAVSSRIDRGPGLPGR